MEIIKIILEITGYMVLSIISGAIILVITKQFIKE